MGCASSKHHKSKCKNYDAPYRAVSRSYSMFVHHPPSKEGDSYHMVALTSSTLGSLRLDHSSSSSNPLPHLANFNAHLDMEEDEKKNEKAEFEVDMMEAKAWSKMIEKKIAKNVPETPVRTPPGEPETIDAWKMMEGLEDGSPLRSFSFHLSMIPDSIERERETERGNGKEMSKSMASGFDTEVISAFRKALDELSPTNPFRLSRFPQHLESNDDPKVNGVLEAVGGDTRLSPGFTDKEARGVVKERLVLYLTSLRGIRKTYEDCCQVRLIFKGLGLRVDERDVSMHSAFKEELRELHRGGGLPRVFVGDKYIGGADEIRRMHEDGSLKKVLQGCELAGDHGYASIGAGCEACGDVRFVPCHTCSGSCKIYYQQDGEEEQAVEEADFGFRRCPDCNENGLIRCPICCH